MDGTILDAALSQGIWAVLAVFLLLYVVKENEKRDLRQEERERNYQAIIGQLTEKLNILDEVENGIADIKSFLSAKLTDTPEKPEKDSERNSRAGKQMHKKKPDGLPSGFFLTF